MLSVLARSAVITKGSALSRFFLSFSTGFPLSFLAALQALASLPSSPRRAQQARRRAGRKKIYPTIFVDEFSSPFRRFSRLLNLPLLVPSLSHARRPHSDVSTVARDAQGAAGTTLSPSFRPLPSNNTQAKSTRSSSQRPSKRPSRPTGRAGILCTRGASADPPERWRGCRSVEVEGVRGRQERDDGQKAVLVPHSALCPPRSAAPGSWLNDRCTGGRATSRNERKPAPEQERKTRPAPLDDGAPTAPGRRSPRCQTLRFVSTVQRVY